MHDLFCTRASQFDGLGTSDSVATLDEASELALLDGADAVAAIQACEARFVSERLPGKRVIVAPMAVTPVEQPQPGDNRTVLFVGTNTAPNVIGIKCFLKEVWPRLQVMRPNSSLQVVGSVCDRLSRVPDGVQLLGFVRALEPLYARAGVVISPLTAGSGLKIKLVEALSHGKAIVASPVTIDGVAHMVESAVCVAGSPEAFADAMASLMRDDVFRREQARKALDAARRWFSPDKCYSDVLDFLDHGPLTAASRRSRDRKSGPTRRRATAKIPTWK
jgi:succinoglycan biosynthesis protein ExoO